MFQELRTKTDLVSSVSSWAPLRVQDAPRGAPRIILASEFGLSLHLLASLQNKLYVYDLRVTADARTFVKTRGFQPLGLRFKGK